MPTILDGKATAQQIYQEIAEEVHLIKKAGGRAPHLAAVLVGHDPASETYIRNKIRACQEVGFNSTLVQYGTQVSEEELLHKIDKINKDEETDGMIVQLPLPDHVSKVKIIDRISPAKDVDGFHHLNFGRMCSNLGAHIPATPYGILELLRRYNIETKGKHVVVVGRSHIVGLPVSILLARGNNPGDATVTITHIHTVGLEQYTRMADILVVAVGKPGLIKADMVKEGVIVVDVGITRVSDSTKKSGFGLKGDVDFDDVAPKSSHITPVPGGVGPMTIAALLLNTLKASKKEVFQNEACWE